MNAGVRRLLSEGAPVPFVAFAREALYGEGGYYARERLRVGTEGADFHTNLSVRSVFAPLVLEAFRGLDGSRRPDEVAFHEIGAEPGQSLFDPGDHPFRDYRRVSFRDTPAPEGGCWVFANEWLDAQPFARLVHRGGRWLEVMVALAEGGGLTATEAEPASPEALAVLGFIPERPFPDGYRLDYAPAAEDLLDALAGGPWHGAFLTFDYGRTWDSLLRDFPAGTGRAYRSHRQVPDLLADPGGQDLTCDLAWDRLEAVLGQRGFTGVATRRQEAFLMEAAAPAIRALMADATRRPRLTQVLSPAHLGTRFQALSAVRRG